MTQDDIIRMAREASGADWGIFRDFMPEIERFAALVAAAECEACAKVLDDWKKHNWTFEDCAAVIRARRQK